MPNGVLGLLTWQARRVRLIAAPEGGGDGARISAVVLCAGDRLDHTPVDVEPHTAWRIVDRPKADEPPRRPERHQPGRSAWRGLATLVATSEPTSDRKSAPAAISQVADLRTRGVLPEDYSLQALIVGVAYGNQQAVIDDVVSDVLPLPIQALLDREDNTVRSTLLSIVDQAEQLRVAANHLGDDLRAAAGVEKMPWDKGQRLGELLVHAFTAPVRRILAGLARHPQDAETAEVIWRLTARRLALEVAEPALEATPATAFLGRERRTGKEIAQRDPDKRRFDRIAVAEAVFRGKLTAILDTQADLDAALREVTRPDERTSA
jgi:CRISPR system Cascade subunit CasA